MASAKVRALTDADFDAAVLQARTPVLVDFWGERCAACDVIAPLLDHLASELDGQATIATLKVEDNPATTMRYRIRGIPALLVFKDGELRETAIDLRDKSRIRELVQKHL